MPFEYVEPTGYLVETTFDHGESWHQIYRGNDRERAVETCNFWDERQDTRFTDFSRLPQDAVSVANRKFDALEQYLRDRVTASGVQTNQGFYQAERHLRNAGEALFAASLL